MSDKPVLIMLCGAPGAGKTTFYESKLKSVFPTMLKASSSPLEQAEIDQERRRLQKEGQSFVYQHVTPELGVVRGAQAAGFEVKVIYIGTEDPNLNIGRILIRVSHGGAFAPLARVASDFEQGLKRLSQISKQVDDLLLFDNTPNGRGVSLVAHFQNGRLAKTAPAIPNWARSCLAKTSVGGRRLRT
jgi:predicted ABC-type ATPase